MKRLIIAILAILLLAGPSIAGTLTASSPGIETTQAEGGYWITYYVTLTQIDADPSNDSYNIPAESFRHIKGGVLWSVAVASSTADADVGVTLTGTGIVVEWFDEEFAQASLPYAIDGKETLGFEPPVIGTTWTIGTDTDWTTAASGDSITVYITVLKREIR
jgi:hypothetical protein